MQHWLYVMKANSLFALASVNNFYGVVNMPPKKKRIELEKIGQRIREARERLGVTQDELAERVGKTQNTISAYENAFRAVRLNDLPMLAQALHVSIGYLFGSEYPENDINELLARLDLLPPDHRQVAIKRLLHELDWWTHIDNDDIDVLEKVAHE